MPGVGGGHLDPGERPAVRQPLPAVAPALTAVTSPASASRPSTFPAVERPIPATCAMPSVVPPAVVSTAALTASSGEPFDSVFVLLLMLDSPLLEPFPGLWRRTW